MKLYQPAVWALGVIFLASAAKGELPELTECEDPIIVCENGPVITNTWPECKYTQADCQGGETDSSPTDPEPDTGIADVCRDPVIECPDGSTMDNVFPDCNTDCGTCENPEVICRDGTALYNLAPSCDVTCPSSEPTFCETPFVTCPDKESVPTNDQELICDADTLCGTCPTIHCPDKSILENLAPSCLLTHEDCGSCKTPTFTCPDGSILPNTPPSCGLSEDDCGTCDGKPVIKCLDGTLVPNKAPSCNVTEADCPKLSCGKPTVLCPGGVTLYNKYPSCSLTEADCPDDGASDEGPGVEGDPHFKTWNGTWYDYMGTCDLVLLDAPQFTTEASLMVSIRTTGRYEYSYVESAAIKLGQDILEVGSYGTYFLNGVEGTRLPKTMADGQYSVSREQVSKKAHRFVVALGEKEELVVETFKDLVSVNLNKVHDERFFGSLGMLGDYQTGKTVARNGVVEISDPELLAAEWQVRPQVDGMIFQTTRAPQYPQPCQHASSKKPNLRSGSTVTMKDAEKSCGHLAGFQKEACVHDVMAIGDLELAATL